MKGLISVIQPSTRYQTPVVNLAWRITGNPEDAAEVGQETFIRVLRSLHTYDPERPLKTWLFKIAANLALDAIRRRKRRPVPIQDLFDEDEGPPLDPVEPGPGPAELHEGRQSAGRFDELVTSLRMVTPAGELSTLATPHTAAGPSLRELALGSEGTLGVITSVTARVRPVPPVRRYEGFFVLPPV